MNEKKNPSVQENPGFTLLEVIVVLIIMGIISAIVIGHMTGNNTDLIAQTEVIKAHLRYAQSRAMNSNVIWGIGSDGSSYWLFRDGNTSNRVVIPGEDSDTVNLSGKGIYSDTFTLSFDSWGRPCTDDAGQSPQVADRTVTISAGSENRLIIITENTGFIQ